LKNGDVVGERFVVERLLGSGGMAEVFLANDRLSGERVAVKVLPAGPDVRARFEREAEILAALDHPGIVRYVAHGAPPGDQALYLAMEYLEGEDLADRIARRILSVDEALVLAKSVASALSAAHAKGVFHRDIKPANLFLVGK
jgi:serine/threonine protein kinase